MLSTKEHLVREQIEAILLDTEEELSEMVYEEYLSGEIVQEELETVYNTLREWSSTSQRLLSLLGSRKLE